MQYCLIISPTLKGKPENFEIGMQRSRIALLLQDISLLQAGQFCLPAGQHAESYTGNTVIIARISLIILVTVPECIFE